MSAPTLRKTPQGTLRRVTSGLLASLLAISLASCTADSGSDSTTPAGRGVGKQNAGDSALKGAGRIITQLDFPVAAPATAQRVVFHSTSANQLPTAISGALLRSNTPWRGFDGHPETAERTPLAIVAPGTLGMADHCAASVSLRYQAPPTPPANELLNQGWNVAIVDYEGLGTPGGHPYMNRLSAGHNVLDMARAALSGMDLPPDTPIAIFGYSQGGGAAASAAELAAQYAPELNVKAVYAGAIPVDLSATAHHITDSALAGLIGYAVNGLLYEYPELHDAIYDLFSPTGQDYLAQTAGECIGDTVAKWPRNDTRAFTKDGKSIAEALDASPDSHLHERVAEQRLGSIAPKVPVFVTHNAADDVLPVDPARELVRQWQDAGATVEYAEVNQALGDGSHGLAYKLTIDQALKWVDDRMVE